MRFKVSMVWEDYTRKEVFLIITLGIQEGKPNSCAVREARVDKYKRRAGIHIRLFIKESHLGVYGCAQHSARETCGDVEHKFLVPTGR